MKKYNYPIDYKRVKHITTLEVSEQSQYFPAPKHTAFEYYIGSWAQGEIILEKQYSSPRFFPPLNIDLIPPQYEYIMYRMYFKIEADIEISIYKQLKLKLYH